METKNNRYNGRTEIRYRESAERLGIDYHEYIRNGEAGKRYCSKCLKWKLRRFFKEYDYTFNYYSGICKVCSPGISLPNKKILTEFNISPSSWGPSLRAAGKIGIEVREYLGKRKEGFRWCSDHRGWFDAQNMLNGNNPNITRCKECNRRRQRELRAIRTRRKNVSESVGVIGDKTGTENLLG